MDPPRLRHGRRDLVPGLVGEHPLVEGVERGQKEQAAHRVGDRIREAPEVIASLLFFFKKRFSWVFEGFRVILRFCKADERAKKRKEESAGVLVLLFGSLGTSQKRKKVKKRKERARK